MSLTRDVRLPVSTWRDSRKLGLVAAALLGAIWDTWLTRLFFIGGYVDVPLMQLMFRLLPRSQFHLLYRPILAGVWMVLIGLICGVPLALIARRRIFLCWLTFALTALVSSAISHWMRGVGMVAFFANWSIPEAWLYLIGVLPFALLTSNLLTRRLVLLPNHLERP